MATWIRVNKNCTVCGRDQVDRVLPRNELREMHSIHLLIGSIGDQSHADAVNVVPTEKGVHHYGMLDLHNVRDTV